jgi:hypothetical protein
VTLPLSLQKLTFIDSVVQITVFDAPQCVLKFKPKFTARPRCQRTSPYMPSPLHSPDRNLKTVTFIPSESIRECTLTQGTQVSQHTVPHAPTPFLRGGRAALTARRRARRSPRSWPARPAAAPRAPPRSRTCAPRHLRPRSLATPSLGPPSRDRLEGGTPRSPTRALGLES